MAVFCALDLWQCFIFLTPLKNNAELSLPFVLSCGEGSKHIFYTFCVNEADSDYLVHHLIGIKYQEKIENFH